MGDEEVQEQADYGYADETVRLEQEVETWKGKFKQLEMKKRESELTLNKIKTEVNSLRSVDKQWKDSAKATFLNILDMQRVFALQVDQIVTSLAVVGKTSDRIQLNARFLKKVKVVIAQLQAKVAMQEETINTLSSRIKVLTVELDDKTKKVERLSQGLEEEVERLVKPMRDRLSDNIVALMKEKAARAQERRELADLWPDEHMLPTLLMKYRALTDAERVKRIAYSIQQNANLALSLEVRANVAESKMWQVKYDDYGRQFYEHSKTGQTAWEAPEIIQYQPPPGRDEMGNVVTNEENDSNNWIIQTDAKGRITYQHKVSKEIITVPPYVYKELPRGRSKEEQVAEAAEVVLQYIKDKISKHIVIKKKRKDELENPLTPEQKRKREKEIKNMTPEELAAREPELSEEGETLDLTLFQYDIETVEMLANQFNPEVQSGDKDPETVRTDQRTFLEESAIRKFPDDLYEDLTLTEIDLTAVTTNQLRGMVENLSQKEEKLECKLAKTRDNLKEFSVLLVEKIREQEVATARKLSEERVARDTERKERRRLLILERSKQREAMKEKRKAEKEAAAALAAAEAAQADDEQDDGHHPGRSDKDGNKEGHTSGEDESEDGDGEEKTKPAPAVLPVEDEDEQEDGELDWSDDEDVLHASKDVDGGTRMDVRTEDDLDTIVSATLGNSVFSELPQADGEADHTPMMPNVTNDLANFAFFCGFNNLHMAESPETFNSNYSLKSDQKASMKKNEDDEWLSCHFFLGCTKEELDACNQTLISEYQNSDGMLPIVLEHDETVKFEGVNGMEIARNESHGYTQTSRQVDDNGHMKAFHMWKAHQLMTDVVQHQLDKEDVFNMLGTRNESYSPAMQEKMAHVAEIRHLQVQFEFKKVKLNFLTPVSPFNGNVYYLQFFFGTISLETDKLSPIFPNFIDFPVIVPKDNFSINDMQLQDLLVELIDQQPESAEQFYLCKGSHSLDGLVGGNFNRLISLTIPLVNNDRRVVCELELQLRAKLISTEMEVANRSDPHNLNRLEELVMEHNEVKTVSAPNSSKAPSGIRLSRQNSSKVPSDAKRLSRQNSRVMLNRQNSRMALSRKNLSMRDAMALDDADDEGDHPDDEDQPAEGGEDWEKAVSELRGDGKITLGDATIDQDMQSDIAANTHGHRNLYPQPIKALPNFNNARVFLEKKLASHLMAVQTLTRGIEERKNVLDDLIKQKQDLLHRLTSDNKSQHKKVVQQAEEFKEQLTLTLKVVADFRKPHPEPKEPEFEDFGPVMYPGQISLPGQLDAKGKKKKMVPKNTLEEIIGKLSKGEFDGKDGIPLPDEFFPNQAQQNLLENARKARSEVLNNQRTQEMNHREHLMQMYRTEHERFVELEEIRNNNLRRSLRDCRKIYIKYENVTYRINAFEEEMRGYEMDLHSVQSLIMMHQRCSSNYKVIVLKFLLEFQRQQGHIKLLKSKLNKLLNARRYLLEYPKCAENKLMYTIYVDKCNKHLKLVKLEIFSLKNLLLQEGIKFRNLLNEEYQFYFNENARINVSIEIFRQRANFDNVIAMYRVNMLNVLVNLVKYKLIEADDDDEGIDTIDGKGEAYSPDKEWQTAEVVKALKALEGYVSKVAALNNYIRSTGSSQTMLIDIVYSQYNGNTFTLRDSYIEHSDYERAQYVVYNIINLYKKHKTEYQLKKMQVSNEILQYTSEKSLVERQMKDNVMIHEVETKYINSNTNIILTALRNYIADYRDATSDKISSLENNIISLSKECQKIREELLAQQMIFNDKIKILWAFIHTLQTSLQQLTAKLEITMEENEKIVIGSKLMADNIKATLRRERQHNANLYFIIHTQRGIVKYLHEVIQKIIMNNHKQSNIYKNEKSALRKEIYNYVFAYTTMCTDVDRLFEFFVSRIANLAGSNAEYNNKLSRYHTPQLLAILCRNGGFNIKYYAAKALGNIGWNSYVEKRILIWDSLTYWKALKKKIVDQAESKAAAAALTKTSAEVVADELDDNIDELDDSNFYATGFDQYDATNNINSIITVYSNAKNGGFNKRATSNISLRTYIKQRRQWALRATKRKEGPNYTNQKLLNIKDNVLPILFELSIAENQQLSFTVETLQEIVSTKLKDPTNKRIDIVLDNINIIHSIVAKMAASSLLPVGQESSKHSVVLTNNDQNYSTQVSRSAALAISIASYELSNHKDILSNYLCLYAILMMCQVKDVEIQTHAAIAIANLAYKNEYAQCLFGALGVVETLTKLMHIPIADVLEAVTSALANLTSYNDENCGKFILNNGIEGAIYVLYSANNNENLLDMDQGDEIQANTAELLTNISRYNTAATIPYFTNGVLNNLVLLCAANNIQCKRYIPLIMGNVSQSNEVRSNIGLLGGVEALFLALENDDHIVKCNVLWALANLMYYPPNQERAGRFILEVCGYIFIHNIHLYTENTRIHACILLGNMLYYNTPNRVRFLETDQALETVLLYIRNKDCIPILEGCLRVLLSLSYLDSIALYLGKEGAFIPVLLSYLVPPYFNNNIIKYILEVLCNLCLHHHNRKAIYDSNGIDLIVPLHAHTDEHIRHLSVSIITHLEDITPEEVLARMREALPIDRVVQLTSHADPLVRAVAAEQIGEHIYRNSTAVNARSMTSTAEVQDAVTSIGGLDSLLAILNNPREPVISLLPALWSLRNLLSNHFQNQSQFHYRDGILVLCKILDGIVMDNIYAEQVEKVIEGVLVALTAAVHKHDRNSRRLVMIGLDSVLALANTSNAGVFTQNKNRKQTLQPLSPSRHADTLPGSAHNSSNRITDIYIQAAVRSEAVQSLVHNLLLLLGPYNYVVCSNCHKKQDLHGTNCLYCAHRLLVDISEVNMQHASPTRKPTSAGAVEGIAPDGSAGKRVAMSQSARIVGEAAVEAKESAAMLLSRSTGLLPAAGGASKFSMARSLPSKKQNI